MDLLIEFLNFLQPYGTHSYVLMFIVLLACGFGFPMPEDVVLVTGGILASRGITDFWTTNAVCMAGVLIGDGTVFSIGRIIGPRVKQTWLFKRIISSGIDSRVNKVFTRWGDRVIFVARFMPGLRTPIFLTAGIYRIKFSKFIILDGTAALISVPVWIWVGDFFGHNLELVHAKMKQFQFGVFGSLALIIIAAIIIYRRRKAVEGEDPIEPRSANQPEKSVP